MAQLLSHINLTQNSLECLLESIVSITNLSNIAGQTSSFDEQLSLSSQTNISIANSNSSLEITDDEYVTQLSEAARYCYEKFLRLLSNEYDWKQYHYSRSMAFILRNIIIDTFQCNKCDYNVVLQRRPSFVSQLDLSFLSDSYNSDDDETYNNMFDERVEDICGMRKFRSL